MLFIICHDDDEGIAVAVVVDDDNDDHMQFAIITSFSIFSAFFIASSWIFKQIK